MKTYYVISISFRDNREYYNSCLIADDHTSTNFDNAEFFESLQVAEEHLEFLKRTKMHWDWSNLYVTIDEVEDCI